MYDNFITLLIKAIEKKKFSEAISIIEVLQEEDEKRDEKRESNDKNNNNIRG